MIEVRTLLRALAWLKPVPGFVPLKHYPGIKIECIINQGECSFMHRNQICVFNNRRQLIECKLYLVTAVADSTTGLVLICDGDNFVVGHCSIDHIKLSSGKKIVIALLVRHFEVSAPQDRLPLPRSSV